MDFVFADFNDAGAYFDDMGKAEWADLQTVISGMPLHLQASDQAGRVGRPIFDPKATNAYLTGESARRGWRRITVPAELQEFGVDWDAGKRATLAEWQFSNYPFVWNNIIRSEAVYKSQITLGELQPIRGLIVVTKGGLFPSSNSTLYYEQAKAQIANVTKFGTFTIPIRLVGLTVLPAVERIEVVWSAYGGRYSRDPVESARRVMTVRKRKVGRYGIQGLSFEDAG